MKMGFGEIFGGTREAAALAKEASADKKRADLKRREAEAHLESELGELRLLHDQIHSAEENVVRAERYYKLTQSEYGRGVKNSPDVLGASEKLFENKLKRLEIIKDFQIAKSHVLAKIGK
jgi:outer membrane protein TolC